MQYGMSARGLAIDTAVNEEEEFSRFSAFWLEKPLKPEQEYLFSYRLHWGERVPVNPRELATVQVTRTGLGGVVGPCLIWFRGILKSPLISGCICAWAMSRSQKPEYTNIHRHPCLNASSIEACPITGLALVDC